MEWGDRIGKRLRLRDLHVLLAVVQAGNMSKAAKQLAVSNPVVTKAVADLEYALGVRLLDRSRKGVELTIYGRALLDRGIVAFDELRQAVKHIEFLSNPTAGEIRIACNFATGVGFISTVIHRLSRQFPRIVFHVLAVPEAGALRALEERNVDLVIGRLFSPVIGELFNAEVLYDDPFVVAAGQQSPWARRRKVALAELVDEPWALPPADSPFGVVVKEAFAGHGLEVPPATVVTSVPIRSALLDGGHFLTIVPKSAIAFSRKNSTLKILPIELSGVRRPIGAITLKNRTANPLVQLIVDCARRVAKLSVKKKDTS